MRKDVREFIRRLEAADFTVQPTPGHDRARCDGSRSARQTARRSCCRSPRHDPLAQSAIVELRKLGIDL